MGVYESSCTTRYVEKQPGKFVGDTACEKLPVEICGAGCVTEEGPEECHDKVITTLIDVPEEVCDLNPQKTCKFQTKLVPKLKPAHECTIIPREFQVTDFTGNDGTFMGGLQFGHQFGLEFAGFLGVQVTDFFGNIDESSDDFVVAFFGTFFSDTTSSTDLNGQFFTSGVSNEFAGLLLNVSGSTRRFIDGSTFLGSLSVADLFEGLVALLESLVDSLLLEGDLTGLLKVLFADFLLGGSELCDISVMTFLNVLVGTFQDGVLLDGLDGLLLFNTAQTGLGVIHTTSEVNSSLDLGSSLGGLLAT